MGGQASPKTDSRIRDSKCVQEKRCQIHKSVMLTIGEAAAQILHKIGWNS